MLRYVVPVLIALAAFATAGHALPPTCGDPCVIQGATPGFVPPVVSIASGTSVVWESLDISHPAGEALPSGNPCFIAPSGPGGPSPPVRFTWDGAVIRADGVPCDSTQALPTGEGVLVYRCLLHGNMVGTIIVT